MRVPGVSCLAVSSSSFPGAVAPPSWAAGVAEGLAGSHIRHVVYVPDNPLAHLLEALRARSANIGQTLATREEEAVGIAAGMYMGGIRPAVLMQSSGLGNCTNAIASLLVAYQVPVVFVMSMRGDPGEWNWAQVPMGRVIRPILDALGVPYVTIDRAAEAASIVRAVCDTAFDTRSPAACLLPRRLTTGADGQ